MFKPILSTVVILRLFVFLLCMQAGEHLEISFSRSLPQMLVPFDP